MLKIYRTNENEEIEKIKKIEPNCWIDVVSPTSDEIDEVVKKTGIDEGLILKLKDEEEVPRIEIEDDSTLIVVDCPYYEGKNSEYYTFPLGIIIKKDYILTISSRKQELLKMVRNNTIKKVFTNMKSRFVIQLLYYNARLYLKYLKLIDKNIDKSEKLLQGYAENKQLISMLNIEKSLVYFISSLRENYILVEKLSKGNVITLYEEDLELLEDAQIENGQAIDMANTYREVLGSVSDAYANIVSNNLNQAMKILTSITILFSVPTMISSFMGMNVPLGKFSTLNIAFLLIILFSILFSVLLAIYLRKKKLL